MSSIPKTEKNGIAVVDIDDDVDAAAASVAPSATNTTTSSEVAPPAPQVQLQHQNLDSRSFWKAGDYIVGSSSKPASFQGHLDHARVHPKFLHTNATSHKWAFGAIAELVDNAVDEIQNGATYVKVDRVDIMKDNSPALSFLDDGGGMSPESLRKCMSLGYSSKKSKTTIGQYGNGFKTSTMRLGADAIVFSRATCSGRATQSVGLLSYTFLRRTGQDDVIVPMIDFDISGHWAEPIIYGSQDDWSAHLKTILEWSPFTSKEELMLQFDDIGLHGTKVVIYNLWLNDEGIYELSFDDDAEDIRLRDEANQGDVKKLRKKAVQLQSHISYRMRYSLRVYLSMLYLRKFSNFQIILRGKPVDQFNIADELKYSQIVSYRPQFAMGSNEATVLTTIGFIKEAPCLNVSGFNVYHKNRLIKPFWKVNPDGSSKGMGVVGVLEANFIEPAHDKQDFENSLLFIRLETRLKQMTNDYWKGHCHLVGYQPLNFKSQNAQKERHVRQSSGHSMNSQSELLADQQEICIGAEDHLSLEQAVGGLAANGMHCSSHEQQGTSAGTPGTVSVDKICEENIVLFMRCEEYRKKDIELKQTVEELEEELKEVQMKCTHLSSLLEAKRKHKNVKGQ
ncbi:putative histidine kinase-like ATPase domain-containing protein [Lupinus albus]|uniref:Putative histidine kinase-like ATPase domain-containing protein n=1 Tax=Lupinus albus TaxID=3870 RepID=A0A6A4Q286_LUPAL|nr:putative histidine kinase-like ATPase domain-containing protein [Lupinus albus]